MPFTASSTGASSSGTMFRSYSGTIGLSCRSETLRCLALMVISVVVYVGCLVFSDEYRTLSKAPFLTIGNETKVGKLLSKFNDSNITDTNNSSNIVSNGGHNTASFQANVSLPRNNSHEWTRTDAFVLLTSLQEQANFGLQGLEARGAFDTILTEKSQVLSNGFPLSWQPCTLARRLARKHRHKVKAGSPKETLRIKVVILGGSLSSASGKNCQANVTRTGEVSDSLSGRYSNVLQASLTRDAEEFSKWSTSTHRHRNDSTSQTLSSQESANSDVTFPFIFEIRNMAQGGTDSVWAGLHMDRLVDPLNTDVLIWEFAVNDFHRPKHREGSYHDGIEDDYSRKLDFWLRRVHSLFSLAGKPPPPILLLYTWDFGIGNKPTDYILQNGLEASTLNQNVWKLVYKCQQRGWNIQVINVGAIVNRKAFASDATLLLDDLHHPACAGVHLLADMIHHSLYTNIATCRATKDEWFGIISAPSADELLRSPESNGILVAANSEDLATLLFEDDIPLGSWTSWKPSIRTSSSLQVDANSLQALAPFIRNEMPQSVSPFREDRKLSVSLPLCSDSESKIFLTVLESNISWLGLDLSHDRVNLMIRDHSVEVSRTGKQISGLDWILFWVFLADNDKHGHTLDANCTISLCKTVEDEDVLFRGLVGLLPKKNLPLEH